MRYLALGDSLTVGTAVAERERFPMKWADALRTAHSSVEVDIIAGDGWFTRDLLSALQRHAPSERYDLCSVLIGVNNQYRRLGMNAFRRELAEILACALERVGRQTDRAVVLSVPNWSGSPFMRVDPFGREPAVVTQEIQELNAAAQELSRAAGVSFIDISDISWHADAASALLASDGLHPSGVVYARWVERLMRWAERQAWFGRSAASSSQVTAGCLRLNGEMQDERT